MTAHRLNGFFEPHRMAVEDLWIRLASSANGLSDAEARERLNYEGPNAIVESRPSPLVIRHLSHLVHPFALLLVAGATLAYRQAIAAFFSATFPAAVWLVRISSALVMLCLGEIIKAVRRAAPA